MHFIYSHRHIENYYVFLNFQFKVDNECNVKRKQGFNGKTEFKIFVTFQNTL